MKFRWFFPFVPLILGVLVGSLLNLTELPNPILLISIDLGTLIFLVGFVITALAFAAVFIWNWGQQIEIRAGNKSIQDRRRFYRLLDHELKNPLTAIMAGLANLSEEHSETQRRNTIQSVAAQVQRINRLVADLRKLTLLETRPIEFSLVDLNELLTELFDYVKNRDPHQRRQFNLQIPQAPWPLPKVTADRDLLSLALLNLLDNAIKFSQPGDTIELRASEEDSAVLIEIADTGPGIPEDEIDEVWNELYRGKGARGIPGSGLGLALVQTIVSRHHGSLAIRSRSGQGTVVSLRLVAANLA